MSYITGALKQYMEVLSDPTATHLPCPSVKIKEQTKMEGLNFSLTEMEVRIKVKTSWELITLEFKDVKELMNCRKQGIYCWTCTTLCLACSGIRSCFSVILVFSKLVEGDWKYIFSTYFMFFRILSCESSMANWKGIVGPVPYTFHVKHLLLPIVGDSWLVE